VPAVGLWSVRSLCRDCAQEMADYFKAYHHVVIRSLWRGL